MVNRCERANLQKCVIDDMNANITEAITQRLKTVKPHSGTPFASPQREVFYFKTADWIYCVACHNIMMNIYRIHRASFWVDSSGNAVFCNLKHTATEMYDIMPTSSATKSELKYCDSYNNHIAKRTNVSHTKVSCPFKMGNNDYLDKLIKNLTDTKHASVIAPDPSCPQNADYYGGIDFVEVEPPDEPLIVAPVAPVELLIAPVAPVAHVELLIAPVAPVAHVKKSHHKKKVPPVELLIAPVAPVAHVEPLIVAPVAPVKKSHHKKKVPPVETPVAPPAVIEIVAPTVEPIIAVKKKSHHKKKTPTV